VITPMAKHILGRKVCRVSENHRGVQLDVGAAAWPVLPNTLDDTCDRAGRRRGGGERPLLHTAGQLHS
jgi:hypothetical protein